MTSLFVTWQLPSAADNAEGAEAVRKALQTIEKRQRLYELRSWVIVSQEVRMLLYPKAGISHIMDTLTEATNQESPPVYEYRWIRSSLECARIVRTMERVPVQAGLVARPEQWPYSSAHTK